MSTPLTLKAKQIDSVDIHDDVDVAGNLHGSHVARHDEAIVIVGTGPVGMHALSELVNRGVDRPVVIYGGEPARPYNRVRLSDYLSGSITPDELAIGMNAADQAHTDTTVEYRYNCLVEAIDTQAKTVTDADGEQQRYCKLILATGSTPFVPKIGNRFYDGVYTFRTLAEADELLSRKLRTRHTVIIGGGLLGLETARAMQRFNTRITIIEHNRWLMMQQLDEAGSDVLLDYVQESGIEVVLGDSVISVTGNGRVAGVSLRSGRHIECDTLIIAAGVRPNIKLATEAGISCNRGIRVDDQLQTSAEDVFAVGECAEHRDKVYGIVMPGLEQASVVADLMAGGDARYLGSLSTTRLKVMSKSVFSAGRTGVDEEARSTVSEYVYRERDTGTYRMVRVFSNRIIGATAVGDWHEAALLNDAIEDRRRLWFWQLWRFRRDGYLWGSEDEMDVTGWPANAVVCNCNGVSRGKLSAAIDGGCGDVACLSRVTKAGGVCGSCKPLLAEMIGSDAAREPVRWWRGMMVFAAITALLVTLFAFISRIPYPDSVQVPVRWDALWRDGFIKQITGFSILGIVAIGLLVSLRKRVSRVSFGAFDGWRMMHVALGVLALLVLVAHTGFSIGEQLNMALMLNFLLLAAVGGYAGKVVATEHRVSSKQARRQRSFWNGLHILLVWSFPVLLGFHVLKTYYY